ncbi:MAG: hypothetical protein OXH70_17495 [Acidobacteria bacterium]|nr:hypothetical protein [Acidobacteriota bacterium]
MDVPCPHCGEPIDTYEFHEEEGGYMHNSARFQKFGCGWYKDQTCSRERPYDAEAASRAQAAMELSDQPDDWGVACDV